MIIVGGINVPMVLGATGSATDIATLTHNNARVYIVEVFSTVTGSPVPLASISVAQPGTNAIVLTNLTAGILSVMVRIMEPEINVGSIGITAEAGTDAKWVLS